MVKNKFTKKLIVIILILVILQIVILIVYFSHSTYWKYNDWWIVGNDIDNVEKRYGEFDFDYGNRKAYYIGKDDAMIMPSHSPQYYWMELDDNGIVTQVYIAGPIGG
ncbi:MAG: hypothetical protein K2M78_01935 [Lachnospiraceae bacterium]|nr:hypothetical protein [Lachnospiraceae bacterium]